MAFSPFILTALMPYSLSGLPPPIATFSFCTSASAAVEPAPVAVAVVVDHASVCVCDSACTFDEEADEVVAVDCPFGFDRAASSASISRSYCFCAHRYCSMLVTQPTWPCPSPDSPEASAIAHPATILSSLLLLLVRIVAALTKSWSPSAWSAPAGTGPLH